MNELEERLESAKKESGMVLKNRGRKTIDQCYVLMGKLESLENEFKKTGGPEKSAALQKIGGMKANLEILSSKINMRYKDLLRLKNAEKFSERGRLRKKC